MAEQAGSTRPVSPFEYELFEGDPDHLRTVVATPAMAGPWIDPASLKLKHRIGRGPFGDVWLATHHQSGDDFDEYHEVAVKMLHPLKEEDTQKLIDKFETIFYKFRGFESACWLYGISILDGKQICIAMKFYEGSIGDRMAKRKGGKLQLSETIGFGIELAKGILDLHSIGILCLNLKPSNFLVNEDDQVFLGDIGISYLLLGISLSNSNMALRLGTPNYMAPELWEPEIRGPISFETDTWGFGCSIVEMLTGTQPFSGKSAEEIYLSVVIKQEKPHVPSGLPPALENVISGCFEYDFRNRPLMLDILRAFESSKDAIYNEGGWAGLGSRGINRRSGGNSYTSWYIAKDTLQMGDAVRSRKPANAGKPQTMDVPEGTIVGLETDTDRDGFVLVRVPGVRNPLRVHVSTLERVTSGFAVGDWVRLKEESNNHSSVGILHSVHRDGNVVAAFIGLASLWRGTISDIQSAEAYFVGQFVRLRANVLAPRFEWPRNSNAPVWATGRISRVLPNGCLVVRFPGRFALGKEPDSFLADPCEVEVVSFSSCPGVVKKYQHIEDFHWAIRPLVIALGLFTAMKLGVSIGRNVSGSLKKGRKNDRDGQAGKGGKPWLRSPVAKLFGGSSGTVTAR